MKEKLKAHYLKWGPQRFVFVTVLLLILTDLVGGYYLRLYWVKLNKSTQLVLMAIQKGQMQLQDFSQSTLVEMAAFLDQSLYFLLFIFFLNNLFFYFFYIRKKLWAQGYVLFYTITAALFSVSFIVDDAGLGNGWLAYNLGSILLYLYLFLGVKMLKEETTLAPKKKGR